MATTTGPLISVEEYLARTEKPNSEYDDDVVYPKPLPTGPHAVIQTRCTLSLNRQGALAVTELTVRVSTNPVRFLVPDIVVVREIPKTYAFEPAILCIEILSPNQGLGEMAKCEKYHAWGVSYCWVIDPGKRTGWEYHSGGEPVKRDRIGVLRAGELAVPLAELFSGLQ